GQSAVLNGAFTFTCTFAVTPISANYSSSSATASIQVTSSGVCAWTASAPNGSFVTITGGSSGSGNGTVNYSVAANGTSSGRSTTLTIAGLSFTVTQSASGVATMAMTATA